MKRPPIPPLQSRLAALTPANLRDALNRHSCAVNVVAVLLTVLALAYITGGLGVLTELFSARHNQTIQPISRDIYVRLLHCPARHITCMISDGHGGAYIAGEDSGIYHYQPNSSHPHRWTRFDQANSPGLVSNHICSLCLDTKGRLWAGTLRHGVCVFNGVKWKHYGLLNGPLGSHVVAIISNPYDESVWMCTEAGVSIYETGRHQWHYLPQAIPGKSDDLTANGLPPNPDCVAFNKQGVAFVGTQCSGLAIGYPPYRHWWLVKGPWKIPTTPAGKGLPSSLINAVVVGQGGRVYVATDAGLAWNSRKNPFVFQYERGADYARKDKQLWHTPANFKMPPRQFLNRLLPADHITCLAVDQNRKLWLGTWHSGLWTNAARDPGAPAQGDIKEMTRAIVRFNTVWRARRAIMARWAKTHPTAAVGGAVTRMPSSVALPPLPLHTRFQVERLDVSAILPLADGAVLIGHHCVGVSEVRLTPRLPDWSRTIAGLFGSLTRLLPWPSGHASLPTPAPAPTTVQLAALYQHLLENNLSPRAATARIVPITDDWRTQGSWLGRYGRYWACLFACCSQPPDFVWSPASIALHHNEKIGPHHWPGDSVRFWVQWLATAKKKVLELPEVYLDSRILMHLTTWPEDRRESELDDRGEAYPITWQGPDLYIYLHIPPGAYTLSLYFKERHIRGFFNRLYHMGRDQVLSLIPLPASYQFISEGAFNTAPLANIRGEAQSRVVNFYGGVWKRFLIRGPMKLAIRIARNYSINSLISGAMLDPLSQHPAPYYYGHHAWQAHEKQRRNFRTKLLAAWRSGQLSGNSSVGRALWPRHPADDSTGSPSAKSTNQRSLALAADVIQALNLLEHRDPAVWAANQRLVYTELLRWCMTRYGVIPKDPQATKIMEKCYYHLGLFHRWEAVEKSRGILISREIEKGLRWDRWRDSYRGLEFRTIRKYVKGIVAAKVSATAKR